MAQILILCPTYDHADALYHSIGSVRAQTHQDWRLHVIGDGAPDRTREIVDELSGLDSRITGSFHTKSVRFGEENRGPAINGSDADYILHLNDDDLWLPTHLDTMVALLDQAEWVNQAPLRVSQDGTAEWLPLNHGTNAARRAVSWAIGPSAGINYVAYRRSAYHRLLHGWSPAPRALGTSDRFQWSKFMAHGDLQVASQASSTVLKFASSAAERKHHTAADRCAELAEWEPRLNDPDTARSIRKRASVASRFTSVFRVHGAWVASDVDEAFGLCGMAPVDADATPAVAVA